MKNTIVTNLYAGPGTGKSTMAAAVFAELKFRGIDCELATEYAKDLVWSKSFKTLECQPYVFGKQLHRVERLYGQVDVVITDSPVLLSVIYDKEESKPFRQYVISQYKKFNNLNVFLERRKPYNPNGRTQSENEAKQIDRFIENLLIELDCNYTKFVSDRESVNPIADLIESKMNDERLM